jgi:tricorn protease
MTHTRIGVASVMIGATLCVAPASPALAQREAGFTPDATMMMTPDVSKDLIAFVYANDLWVVDKAGGTARRLASPPGMEMRPRFSPDGSRVAFQGNYEGDRDLYVVPTDGVGVSERVTYHPTNEFLCDWVDDDTLLFHAGLMHNHPKAAQLFKVSATGGLPEALPIAYGTLGAISPDGDWLAYTPHTRDNRTWKRYRGGMATDIWLFNLNTYESRRITEWEGTDTQPMWSPDGESIYYVSDAGPEHRWNIWRYDVDSGRREQVTTFEDFDVKDVSIGPGARGQGEIVFQLGSEMRLLDCRTGRTRVVEIVIPGEREGLRERVVDASNYVVSGDISSTGKRVVTEARGDIWSLPADEGITRNLTRTDGVAERFPIWSPDGRWIAFLSDTTGEYEVYVTQSDGKGETRQLTTDGDRWRQLQSWSPDSEMIAYTDKSGRLFLLDVESGEQTLIATDPHAEAPSPSWSHDSNWLAFSLANRENAFGQVHLYNIEAGELHTVTSEMFNSYAPAFDRKGEYLYFATNRNFTPQYSGIPTDTSFVYKDTGVLVAVPLNMDVENPWALENDEEEWEEEEETEEGEDGKDAEGDDAEAADEEEAMDPAYAPYDLEHPLYGRWSGDVKNLDAVNIMGQQIFPDAEMPYAVSILVTKEGDVLMLSEFQGEENAPDSAEWDDDAGTLTTTSVQEPGIESKTVYTLNGDTLNGAWTIKFPEMMGGSTFSGGVALERAEDELDVDQIEAIEEEAGDTGGGDDEPVEIVIEDFEKRAIMLPVQAGTFSNMAVNDKNQLVYVRMGEGLPSIKLYDIEDGDEGEKNVLAGAFGFAMSGDGKELVAVGPAGWAVVSASPGQSMSNMIDTSAMQTRIDPREEWRNVVVDSWRRFRDFFYDPGMHGVDWQSVLDRYLPLVDDAVSRENVSYIIREMISELNVGHAYYREGAVESGPSVPVGMLGVDFALAEDEAGNTGYQIAKIYQGAEWDVDARGPFSMPGMDVEEGDFILAVNGLEMDTDKDPWAAFVRTSGRTTLLTVSDDAELGNDDDREVLVEPHSPGQEYQLRFRAWIEANRQAVDYKSGGEIGYIYVTNTGVPGQTDLFRQFFGQRHKPALIIDERWNGGGQIPTRFIELLNRPITNYWALRDGVDWHWPPDSHQGPKAMLINGLAGSGGDMFPALFKQAGLGKLIGTRTWGGLVGITGMPAMIDGSSVSVPGFAYYEKDGTWGIEGHGVDPDIEVVADPALMVDDEDPQLNAAVEHLLQELETKRWVRPERPEGPDRSGMGIPERDR